ncbi:MAG: glycosyltransferase [Rhodomicrobium sp.]
MRSPERVAICVCTSRRPQMLADCLASLSRLVPIEGVETDIIVIDNEPGGSQKGSGAAECFGAHYRNKPESGIPQARKAALDAARGLGATHLAFIDDDETADRDWLASLWPTMAAFNADVVRGLVRYVYPEDAPAWRRRKEKAPYPEQQNAQLDGRASVFFCVCVSGCQFRVSTGSIVPRGPARFCLLKADEPNCNLLKYHKGLAAILNAARKSHCEYRRSPVPLQVFCGPWNRAPHGIFNNMR